MTSDDRLIISARVTIPLSEIELTAIRAQGAGGQNVNKVSSAIHLRFDIRASSLPEFYQQRLLKLADRRISKEGVIVIKAQTARSQEQNRDEALQRLAELVRSVAAVQKKRIATKPSRSSQRKRVEGKKRRSQVKNLRRRIDHE